jgi:uncharacterized protein YcbK (DUF882 family)
MATTWRKWLPIAIAAGIPALLVAMLPAPAAADVTHTVQKGETIQSVAQKYGVTVKVLLGANKIKDPSHLAPGSKLVIPGKSGPVGAASSSSANGTKYTGNPKHPGRVVFVRLVNGEKRELQVVNKKGKLQPGVLPAMSKLMRFPINNQEHAIESRLVENLAKVSDHFGGKPLEIISGFRPKTPGQYTAHSNHNIGAAMDFRIQGVPNEVLRDYCRTFKDTGVGYYPNSLFVHFDVRKQSTYWVDLSGPGQAPRYVNPGTWAADPDHDNPYGETGAKPAGSIPGGASTTSTPPAATTAAPVAAASGGQK